MKQRRCERCHWGTETCVVSNFYTCDSCDATTKPYLSLDSSCTGELDLMDPMTYQETKIHGHETHHWYPNGYHYKQEVIIVCVTCQISLLLTREEVTKARKSLDSTNTATPMNPSGVIA